MEFEEKYQLNEDQRIALRRIAAMFCSESCSSEAVTLVHGTSCVRL